MQAVLISINPQWCELIAEGKKTVEVRKTKPKLITPFKVYIYCTKGKGETLYKWCGQYFYDTQDPKNRPNRLDGKVIGEFVCDAIITDKTFGHDILFNAAACMSDAEVASYCLNKEMYGWHISNLVLYDKPRDLSDFDKPHDYIHQSYRKRNSFFKGITRPPQSWCYVEA